jgi:AsmA protein
MAFTSQGIRIENATINWENQQSGQQIEVSNIGFKTSVIALNTPIISDFNMTVRDKKQQLALSLNGQTTLTTNSGFRVFHLENNALHSIIAGTVIPGKSLAFTLSSKDVLFDKTEQLLKASDVQLKLAGMQITSDIMSRFTNKPATVTGHMRVITFNPSQFMQQLAAEFNFQATDTAVAVNNLTMTLDNSRLTGSVAIKNSAKPTTLLRLHIDNLAVDGYLPAQHTPEKSIDPATILAAMPVEALRKLRISGCVVVDKLLVHGAHLQQVSLNLAH